MGKKKRKTVKTLKGEKGKEDTSLEKLPARRAVCVWIQKTKRSKNYRTRQEIRTKTKNNTDKVLGFSLRRCAATHQRPFLTSIAVFVD